MSLSKSKCLYSNNCLRFLKRVVPLSGASFGKKSFRIKVAGDAWRSMEVRPSLMVSAPWRGGRSLRADSYGC
jgi:hypothetical protein